MVTPVELDWGGIMLSKRLIALLILWSALLPSVVLSKQYMEPAWQSALYEIIPKFLKGKVNTIVFMALSCLLFSLLFLNGIFEPGNWRDITSAFLIFLCSCPLFVRFFQSVEGPFRGEFGHWLYGHKSEILKKGKADFRGTPITVETRVVRYNAVLSYLLVTKPFESPLILIDQKRIYSFLTLISYSFLTFLFGWWNIPKGAIQTFRAIFSNLKGGQIKTVGSILADWTIKRSSSI